MRRGVVIRVVTVAFFGNGSLSSSSPQAAGPPRSGTYLGAKEKKIAANETRITRPIHRNFIALTSLLFVMFQMNQFGFTPSALNKLGHGCSSFSELVEWTKVSEGGHSGTNAHSSDADSSSASGMPRSVHEACFK